MSGGNLVVVGGTTERRWGLLAPLTRRPGWESYWVRYPASYGAPTSYERSVRAGVEATKRTLRGFAMLDADSPVVLVGYSQGAVVAELAVREMLCDPARYRVDYLALVASPLRPAGVQVGDDPGGSGISEALPPPNPGIKPSFWWEYFALPGDIITCCPPDSLLRLVEQLTPAMSVTDPAGWARDVQRKLTLRWLLASFPELRKLRALPQLLARIHAAGDDLTEYLATGIHTRYGSVRLPGTDTTALDHIATRMTALER